MSVAGVPSEVTAAEFAPSLKTEPGVSVLSIKYFVDRPDHSVHELSLQGDNSEQ